MASRLLLRASLVLGALGIPASCADSTPRAFTDRENLPSCGALEFPLSATLTPDQKAIVQCFTAAATSGAAAEMAVVRRTTEGDPVRTWIRALPGGGVERWVHSEDSFGERGWSFAACQSIQIDPFGIPSPTGCDGEGNP